MSRVYNFSAGPAVLPESVLKEAAAEMLDYKGTGMSVMEMSHRSKAYDEIIKTAEKDLRDLMNIPDNYKVLFLQGGATGMFAALAQNLGVTGSADYVISGNFSGNAYKEAKKYLADARVAATTKEENFSRVPSQEELVLNPEAGPKILNNSYPAISAMAVGYFSGSVSGCPAWYISLYKPKLLTLPALHMANAMEARDA